MHVGTSPGARRRRRPRIVGLGVIMAMIAGSGAVWAAPAPAPSPDVPALEPAADKVELNADQLDFDRANKLVEAIGNVVIRKGAEVLRADYVRYSTDTEVAQAVGNVIMTRGTDEWRGPTLTYNFKTGAGLARKFRGEAAPFQVKAEESEKTPESLFIFRNAEITTCDRPDAHWHYHVAAREVELEPGEWIKGHGCVWRFGRVPVFYLPYWYSSLNSDSGWRFTPGQSSRMGPFLLSSYRYRLNPGLRARTHLDWRSERGVGLGQDFMWNFGDDTTVGKLRAYYLDDKEPLDEGDDPVSSDLDNERYRFRVENLHALTMRDSVRVQGDYLSDTDVLDDFFERDFRNERQPDNFVSYTHRGDGFALSAIARSRLNDFYESVNRLPEVSLDVFRRPLDVGDLFYESRTAAAALERVFPDHKDQESYSAFRMDTRHTVLRPDKHFGFLVMTPRVGYRGTYYSATREETITQEVVATEATREVVSASGVTNLVVTTGVETNTITTVTDGPEEVRSNVEFGLATSFKAFRIWDSDERRYRHVLEPFANWTVIPEPTVTPDRLYQFDAVDQVDEDNFVKLGVRNKLQTRREIDPARLRAYELQTQRRIGTSDSEDGDVGAVGAGSGQDRRGAVSMDLADVEVYTIYRIQREEEQDALEDVFWDAEFRPSDWLALDSDGNWDLINGEFERFNTEATLTPSDLYRATLEHRYRVNSSSLFYGDLTLFPLAPWTLNVYGRYEFEDSRFEEQGGYIQRTLDCLALRLGGSYIPSYTRSDGTEREDEYRVLVEFWFTAFPDNSLSGKQRG